MSSSSMLVGNFENADCDNAEDDTNNDNSINAFDRHDLEAEDDDDNEESAFDSTPFIAAAVGKFVCVWL